MAFGSVPSGPVAAIRRSKMKGGMSAAEAVESCRMDRRRIRKTKVVAEHIRKPRDRPQIWGLRQDKLI
jgi:hypothetical protein